MRTSYTVLAKLTTGKTILRDIYTRSTQATPHTDIYTEYVPCEYRPLHTGRVVLQDGDAVMLMD